MTLPTAVTAVPVCSALLLCSTEYPTGICLSVCQMSCGRLLLSNKTKKAVTIGKSLPTLGVDE